MAQTHPCHLPALDLGKQRPQDGHQGDGRPRILRIVSTPRFYTVPAPLPALHASSTISMNVPCGATLTTSDSRASECQAQLDRWNFRKKVNTDVWKYVEHQTRKRKREGKDTEVIISGRRIDPKKVRKATSRNFYTPMELRQNRMCQSEE
jgi:hypothetical protein